MRDPFDKAILEMRVHRNAACTTTGQKNAIANKIITFHLSLSSFVLRNPQKQILHMFGCARKGLVTNRCKVTP